MKKLRKATGHTLKLIPIWDIRECSEGDATRTSMNNHGTFLGSVIPTPGLEKTQDPTKVEQHNTLTLQSSHWKTGQI